MQTLYEIVGLPGYSDRLLTREELEDTGLVIGIEEGPAHVRPELQNQPRLRDLCGGMWGGWRDAAGESVFLENDKDPNSAPKPYSRHAGPVVACVVRYETWEAYEMLSR